MLDLSDIWVCLVATGVWRVASVTETAGRATDNRGSNLAPCHTPLRKLYQVNIVTEISQESSILASYGVEGLRFVVGGCNCGAEILHKFVAAAGMAPWCGLDQLVGRGGPAESRGCFYSQ